MKNFRNLLLVFSLSLTFFTISCSKEKVEILEVEDLSDTKEWLVFENSEEFLDAYRMIINSSLEDIENWERTKSFTSLGTICDKFYMSIDIEQFESTEEVLLFAKNNSEYIQIIEEDGELTLETILFDNPQRYLMNKDGFFQIANNVYKVIEDYTIGADINDFDEIKNINNNNIYEIFDNDKVFLLKGEKNALSTKCVEYNCGNYTTKRNTINNNRIYLRISVDALNLGGGGIPPFTQEFTNFMVRPYRRTLGVWFWVERYVSCELRIATGYYTYFDYSWYRVFSHYIRTNVLTRSLSGTLSDNIISYGSWVPSISHFDGYDVWASTPQAGKAQTSCINPLGHP
jgi:hypothetical protein